MPAPALRWAAIGSALMVWMLGLLAASPQLHAALHKDAGHNEHVCAVTLFSQGVESTTPPTGFTVAPLVLLADSPVPVDLCPAAPPRYRLLPGRAPPAR
jgi:hypothetical protein